MADIVVKKKVNIPEMEKCLDDLALKNVILQKKLEEYEEKIKHLETLLNNVPSNLAVASKEEELCKIEIARLFEMAKQGRLEWNDTKAFEVYAKTLLAIKGKPQEPSKKEKTQAISHDQLLQLALQATNDNNEQ